MAVIMRMSSYSLPQRATHFSEGTARVSRVGPPPEQREATLALLKTCNRLLGNFEAHQFLEFDVEPALSADGNVEIVKRLAHLWIVSHGLKDQGVEFRSTFDEHIQCHT